MTKKSSILRSGLLVGGFALLLGCGSGGGGAGEEPDGAPGGGADGGGEGTPDAGGSGYEWPASADDYQAEKATYANALTIPEVQNDTPACCTDFGDISKNEGTDNALARLENTLQAIDQSIQVGIDQGIADGDLVLLLDHRDLEGGSDSFVLAQFLGAFASGTTFADADAGNGEFLLTPESFVSGSGEPKNFFDPAEMSSGELSAGPAQIAVDFPFEGVLLQIAIDEAELTGTATINESSVTYQNGTLSGWVTLEDFFGALNDVAASPQCDCLGLDGDLFVDNNGWEENCVSDAANKCDGPGEAVCANIGGDDFTNDEACTLLPGFLEEEADIDLNNDPSRYEALSIGLMWSGVEASVVGLAP